LNVFARPQRGSNAVVIADVAIAVLLAVDFAVVIVESSW